MLLKQQGYDVVGLFMRTGAHADRQRTSRRDHKKGCCSAIDAGDARRVADRLDIPFYALDFERDFDRIIDYFADEYLAGRTPNPCVVCNNWLKFGQLWAFARATRRRPHRHRPLRRAIENGSAACKAVDPDKDQSYVLHGIRREVLPHLLFPIGGLRKEEVRALAREAGLGVAEKPDSVEICFVPDGDHAALDPASPAGVGDGRRHRRRSRHGARRARRHRALHDRPAQGPRHRDRPRRFVLDIVPETREVVVGDPEDLLAGGLVASRVNWLIDRPTEPLRCAAKIRYRHAGAAATVTATADGGGARRLRRAAVGRHAGPGGRLLRRRAGPGRRVD